MPVNYSIKDICEQLGVSRNWVYQNIDPNVERITGKKQGQLVLYDAQSLRRFVAESVKAYRFTWPYDFSIKSPDRQATRDAQDAINEIHEQRRETKAVDILALGLAEDKFKETLCAEDVELICRAEEYNSRHRAEPVAIETPEWLFDKLDAGLFDTLRSVKQIQEDTEGLKGKSLELAYRHIWNSSMLRIELFGRTYYVPDKNIATVTPIDDKSVIHVVAAKLLF